MAVLERILTMGITGSGKSYQWLKMAEDLLPTKARFRCLDTDNAIPFMLETQFQHLMPANGGNVYVHQAADWPSYKLGIDWLLRRQIKQETLKELEYLEADVVNDYTKAKVNPWDWTIIDMVDNAWKTVQNYFIGEVFGEDPGEYFLMIRKEIAQGLHKTKKGEAPASAITAALDGWKDWSVINKLYDDFILPVVYRIKTHVYATTKVERVDREEKDAELRLLFGDIGLRPAGQKALGHQMHSIFLFIPGKDRWFVTTVKDRGGRNTGRGYFNKVQMTSFFRQYLVAKVGWELPAPVGAKVLTQHGRT
jgi:hypothetical protein